MFKKVLPEDAQCRYCNHIQEINGTYNCRYKGAVSPSDVCRRYRFDPFASRGYRKRVLDTTGFDPLDFDI